MMNEKKYMKKIYTSHTLIQRFTDTYMVIYMTLWDFNFYQYIQKNAVIV